MRGSDIYINGVRLPVTPPEITFKQPTDAKQYDLLGKGPVEVLKGGKLPEIPLKGLLLHFPVSDLQTGGAASIIDMLIALAESGTPARMVYVGTNWDINELVSIQDVEVSEKGGAPGVWEYSFRLKRWVSYEAKRVAFKPQIQAQYNLSSQNEIKTDTKKKASSKKKSTAKGYSIGSAYTGAASYSGSGTPSNGNGENTLAKVTNSVVDMAVSGIMGTGAGMAAGKAAEETIRNAMQGAKRDLVGRSTGFTGAGSSRSW